MRIVLQVTSATSSKTPESGGSEGVSLVQNECAGCFVEDFEQTVHVHERQIVYRQEIAGAGRVRRPAIGVDVEDRFGRRRGASFPDLHARTAIQLGEGAASAQLNELNDVARRQPTRRTNQISPL